MLKIGIIGFGKMGQVRAKAIHSCGHGEIISVCDVSSNSDLIAERVVRAESPEALISNPDINAVFICTPNYLNESLAIMALNAGKHVFCEKPPAFTAAGVKNVQSAEQNSGKALMYGFNHRHHESIKKIKDIVHSEELGKVLWMRGRYGKEVGIDFFKGWRAEHELAGGGIMLDQGIHMLDLMIHLGGGFDEVQAMVSNLYWKSKGIEDNVFVNLRSSNSGICASVHSTMTQWRHIFSLEVFLEGGAIVLNGLKTSSGAYGEEDLVIKRNPSHLASASYDSEEQHSYETDTSWQSEVEHFISCIENNQPITLGTSTDALNVMRIMDQIYNRV